MAKRFWMVWNPRGSAPVCRHSVIESATAEAERLARLNHGVPFFVLEAIEMRMVDDMRRVKLSGDGMSEDDCEIPF